jgi:hypothetical protein
LREAAPAALARKVRAGGYWPDDLPIPSRSDRGRGWSELHTLVDSLPPDRVATPGYFAEGWSAKDDEGVRASAPPTLPVPTMATCIRSSLPSVSSSVWSFVGFSLGSVQLLRVSRAARARTTSRGGRPRYSSHHFIGYPAWFQATRPPRSVITRSGSYPPPISRRAARALVYSSGQAQYRTIVWPSGTDRSAG